MKGFFKTMLRIATAMLLVVVIIGLAVWGFQTWSSYRENVRNASLQTPRDWPRLKIQGLGSSELSLKTLWRDGRASYVFEVEKYTGSKSKREWILVFTDSHGFELFKHSISNASATTMSCLASLPEATCLSVLMTSGEQHTGKSLGLTEEWG